MGLTAEEIASRYRIPKAEQDAFAAESQRRAVQALRDGTFAAEIVLCFYPEGELQRVDVDEYPRAGTTVENPAAPAGVHERRLGHGRQCIGINDGAAALVVTSARKAAELGARPLARILAHARRASPESRASARCPRSAAHWTAQASRQRHRPVRAE
jgi:acetyl-CoA C-acetyltransferase